MKSIIRHVLKICVVMRRFCVAFLNIGVYIVSTMQENACNRTARKCAVRPNKTQISLYITKYTFPHFATQVDSMGRLSKLLWGKKVKKKKQSSSVFIRYVCCWLSQGVLNISSMTLLIMFIFNVPVCEKEITSKVWTPCFHPYLLCCSLFNSNI